jgi:hypothetical protein
MPSGNSGRLSSVWFYLSSSCFNPLGCLAWS